MCGKSNFQRARKYRLRNKGEPNQTSMIELSGLQ